MNQYLKLVEFVNNGLRLNRQKELEINTHEDLYIDLYNIPKKALLSVNNDSDFIKRVFLILLDRAIDDNHFKHILDKMQSGKLTREQFMNHVYNSAERKKKKTDFMSSEE